MVPIGRLSVDVYLQFECCDGMNDIMNIIFRVGHEYKVFSEQGSHANVKFPDFSMTKKMNFLDL